MIQCPHDLYPFIVTDPLHTHILCLPPTNCTGTELLSAFSSNCRAAKKKEYDRKNNTEDDIAQPI